MAKYNFDCLRFRGDKPCTHSDDCAQCGHYDPWSTKIAIIKLGGPGDVLRTTPVLFAFKRKFPKSHITWITRRDAADMLECSTRVNRIVYVDQPDSGGILRLMAEEFDEVHCYDKDDAALALASLVRAKRKYGFTMNAQGHVSPASSSSEYFFELGLSDDLRFFRNKKSYQSLLYESSGLSEPAEGMDPYDFSLTKADREPADFLMKRLRWDRRKGGQHIPVVGFCFAASRHYRTRQWLDEHFVELARLLKKKMRAHVLLLGTEEEDIRVQRLATVLRGVAHYPGAGFSARQFAGLLERCDVVVTGDSVAMHLAVGVRTPSVALFGATCEQEVDLYGLGTKLVSRPDCAPCYKKECDQEDWMKCMVAITPQHVFHSVVELLHRGSGPSTPPGSLA